MLFLPLHMVRGELASVIHHHIVSWRDGTLSNVLANEEEVVPVRSGDGVIHDATRGRILKIVPILQEMKLKAQV